MKVREYKKVKSMLQSVGTSTCADIQFKDLLYGFCGMNSPYKSHRVMVIESKGHRTPEAVLMKNSRFSIVIASGSYQITVKGKYASYIKKVEIPSFIVRNYGFWNYPIDIPAWMTTYPLLDVYFIDPFDGFDADGNPQFNNEVENNMSIHLVDKEITLVKK